MKQKTIEALRTVLTLLITANKDDPNHNISRAIDIIQGLLFGK